MATVRQRASGSWQVIVQVRQPNGQRRQESRTFPTEAEARTYAHKLEYDVHSGDMPADRATIRQLADAWIQRGRHTKPSSHSAYRHALNKAVAELSADLNAHRWSSGPHRSSQLRRASARASCRVHRQDRA